MLRPIKNNQTREYEMRSNNENKELLGDDDIIQILKRSKMSWLEHVWRPSNALNQKLEGEILLDKSKKRQTGELNQNFRIHLESITRKKLLIIGRIEESYVEL